MRNFINITVVNVYNVPPEEKENNKETLEVEATKLIAGGQAAPLSKYNSSATNKQAKGSKLQKLVNITLLLEAILTVAITGYSALSFGIPLEFHIAKVCFTTAKVLMSLALQYFTNK